MIACQLIYLVSQFPETEQYISVMTTISVSDTIEAHSFELAYFNFRAISK